MQLCFVLTLKMAVKMDARVYVFIQKIEPRDFMH